MGGTREYMDAAVEVLACVKALEAAITKAHKAGIKVELRLQYLAIDPGGPTMPDLSLVMRRDEVHRDEEG